jgi:hypothetical protein
MIRHCDWRDLPLLHRVRNTGLCLDSHLDCTRGPQALQDVLLDPLIPGRTTCTLIARPSQPDQSFMAGQFMLRVGQKNARLTFLGPVDAITHPGGTRLIEALGQAAGARGAYNLIAEIDESSPIFEILRRAGFAIYARQRIWRLTEKPEGDFAARDAAWRGEAIADNPAILSLYTNLVPALVQQVEPPPERNGRNLVHWDKEELLGFVDVDHGPRGIWAQPFFHPAAELTDELLSGLLTNPNLKRNKPLYLCIRSYQAGRSGSLERLGFSPCSDQAVMVKRLTAALRQREPATIHALEGRHPEPTAPIARMNNHKPAS